MVSPMRTFVEELVAKVKGKAPPPDPGSSPPNHVMNLSLVKVQCADMFTAFCNFVTVLIAKLKIKVPFKSGNSTPGPFIVSYPLKETFQKLVRKRSKKRDLPKDGDEGKKN